MISPERARKGSAASSVKVSSSVISSQSASSSPMKKTSWKSKFRGLSKSTSSPATSSIPFFSPEKDCDPITPPLFNTRTFSDWSHYSDESLTPLTDINNSPFSFHKSVKVSPEKGPMVKNFALTQSQQGDSKPKPEDTCFICEESLHNKFSDEILVQLKCLDFLHESCFRLKLDMEIPSLCSVDKFNAVFDRTKLFEKLSTCEGRICSQRGMAGLLIPLDDDYREKISLDLLSKSSFPDTTEKSLNKTRLSSTLIPINNAGSLESFGSNPAHKKMAAKNPPKLSLVGEYGHHSSPFLNSPMSASSHQTTFDKKFIPRRQAPSPNASNISLRSELRAHKKLPSFRSQGNYKYESTLASDKESFEGDETNTQVQIISYKDLSKDELHSHLISHLLDNSSGFSLSNLLNMGNLRLVDHLLVSHNGNSYEPETVFLFENYLVLLSETKGYPRKLSLDKMEVSITNSSTIKISSTGDSALQIHLRSQVSCIIEKWGVAFSDTTYDFPGDVITSTLRIPGLEGTRLSRVPSMHSSFSTFDRTDDSEQFSIPSPILEDGSTSSNDTLSLNRQEELEEVEKAQFSHPSFFHSTDCSDSDIDSDEEMIELVLERSLSQKRIDNLFTRNSLKERQKITNNGQHINHADDEWMHLIRQVNCSITDRYEL